MERRDKKSTNVESKEIEYEISSGNVFKDFGYKNPEEAKAKSDLAFLIRTVIKQADLSQEIAAEIMGIDQPKVSKITRGKLAEFTLEWLMNCLVALGFDVEIRATRRSQNPSIHVAKINLLRAVGT
jgi:predicted XRE-type DNA-binding protein